MPTKRRTPPKSSKRASAKARGSSSRPKAALKVKPAPKPAPKAKTAMPATPAKPVRKGITIVTPKPVKKPKGKASSLVLPTFGSQLLKPGTRHKPLIASGPSAPKPSHLHIPAEGAEQRKSPFDRRQTERFREILLRKRSELMGDMSSLESEALMAQSGSLSNLPQHMAEQGSDAAGQSLSLDLAAADRRLIKEIDDALKRIEAGTYGICELTGKPIKVDRLEELPWARYSIEAARELERRSRMP